MADDQYRFLRVNTVLQRSGDPSRAYFVKPGGMAVVTVSVTAEDGVTMMNYVVVVRPGLAKRGGSPRRPPRFDERLMTLAFSPGVYLYSLGPLRYDQNTVQVTQCDGPGPRSASSSTARDSHLDPYRDRLKSRKDTVTAQSHSGEWHGGGDGLGRERDDIQDIPNFGHPATWRQYPTTTRRSGS